MRYFKMHPPHDEVEVRTNRYHLDVLGEYQSMNGTCGGPKDSRPNLKLATIYVSFCQKVIPRI
jgi:hypothetical protein